MTATSWTAGQVNAATAELVKVLESVVEMTVRHGNAPLTIAKIRSDAWPIYAASAILRAAVENGSEAQS